MKNNILAFLFSCALILCAPMVALAQSDGVSMGASPGSSLSVGGTSGQLQTNNGSGGLGAVAAPAGAVVGTTDSQALTNKTISGASNTLSGPIVGTTTNDSAGTGNVGEDLTSAAAGVSLSSGNPATVTSKQITAGQYLAFCTFQFTGGSSTTVTRLLGSISTTTNTVNSTPGFRGDVVPNGAAVYASGNPSLVVGPVVLKIANAATPTYYCVAQSEFGTSTTTVSAQFTAIRSR